jgi:two-component system sensor histidine kinase DesK
MRLRLLPEDSELGWVPYAWLVYLVGFVAGVLIPPTALWEWVVSGLGLGLFLVLYFWGYWLEGRKLLAVIGGISGLGALFLPINLGAGGFFIYAASFVGRVGPPRTALRWLLLVSAAPGIEALALGLPWHRWVWAVGFALLIGGVNIHFSEVSRQNAMLRQARSEVEHLARVAERERIARDLHDLLGHTLSVIVRKAELASKLAERDPARAAQEIREVEKISRQALAEVRSAVRGYRSEGLAAELAAARAALEAAGVELEARVEPGPLEPAEEAALALVLREGVTNVIRHAAARRCWVRLERAGQGLRLEVRDDGRGGAAPEGSGLRGMRERLGELGGALQADGRDGMRLCATLPGKAQAREGAA